MPPKSRITRQMILDASFALVHESGIQSLNVRSVAARLKCSTQPVMYHFSTMEELKTEIYTIVSQQHSAQIMDIDLATDPNPCLTMGRKYINFALENVHLFRFLFQTDRVISRSLTDMLESEPFAPIFDAMAEKLDLTQTEARDVFASTFIAVHGFACLLANNSMDYSPQYSETLINYVFSGALNHVRAQRN